MPRQNSDHATLDRLFGACDSLIHPARVDVTGTVIVEALGAGLPVVTMANCGYAIHVIASGAGIVLPAHATASMIAATAVVVKENRGSLSKLAREYVSTTDLTTGIHAAATRIEEVAGQFWKAPSPQTRADGCINKPPASAW